MMKRSWIRKVFLLPVTHSIRKVRRRSPLALEVLEERTVPSQFNWTSLRDGGSVGLPHIDPIRPTGVSSGGAALLPPTNLVYFGGPLIQNVQIQQIFFKDSQSGAETPYEAQLDGFYQAITSDAYIPTLAGPYSANGFTIGTGTVGADDHVSIASDAVHQVAGLNTISDSSIQNTIFQEIVNTHGTAPDNPNTVYCVFTPPGDVVTFGNNGTGGNSLTSFEAYHSFFTYNIGSGPHTVYYAVMPDEPTNHPQFQGLTVAASHEMTEAITDPTGAGWIDPSSGSEIGDLAEGNAYSQDGYTVQYEWSNPLQAPAAALGTAAPSLFINQITPAAVNGPLSAGTPLLTFTDPDPTRTPSDFSVSVIDSQLGSLPVSIQSHGQGLYTVSVATGGFSYGNFQGTGSMSALVIDNHNGDANLGAPTANLQTLYQVAPSNPLLYTTDSGVNHLVLRQNGASLELSDNGLLVYRQALSQTPSVLLGAGPACDNSLTLDYSGGRFTVPVTFDGGSGGGSHVLFVEGATFASETFNPTGPGAGVWTLDGQTVTVSHLTTFADASTVTSITVTPGNPSVGEGLADQFAAMGTFPGGLTEDISSLVSWASTTPSVATIDASGLATTQTAGTSVITASFDGVSSPGVTLTSLPLIALAVGPTGPTVPVLLSVPLTALGTYSDGSTHDLTGAVAWASSMPAVATVDTTGLATANAHGTSVITASLFGVTSPGDVLTAIAPSFAVNTMADDLSYTQGKTSLREAILAANAYPKHTITFDPAVFATAQTITLTLGELELTDTTGTETIKGPAAGVTVTGGGRSRVFQVDSGVTASFSGMTITGGSTPGDGGGLLDAGGKVTLNSCTISGNSAFHGGGLSVQSGTAILINCTMTGNSAQFGGALDNLGTAVLTNCTISGDSGGSGGGLRNLGTVTLTNCAVSGNAGEYGGGLRNSGTAMLTNCTVSGNSAPFGGGLRNSGTATLTNCTVSGNSARFGGGVEDIFGTATLNLKNSTISGNLAGFGGGLETYGTATLNLTNCAVSKNLAGFGGGLQNYGTATFTDCAVSGNLATVGGALDNNSTATLNLTKCIVSDNSAGYGGGLFNDGTATLTNSIVLNNSAGFGGGLENSFSTATLNLTNCSVSGNSATRSGGALENYAGTATLTNCTISGNSAARSGGGVLNRGTATLTNCAVSSNSATFGGGLRDFFGTATLTNCTISGNITGNAGSYGYGGGLYDSFSTTTLTNCTISGNSTGPIGGGGGGLLFSHNMTTLTNCTISGNFVPGAGGSGGGLQTEFGTTALINSIISGNSAGFNGGGLANYGDNTTLTNCTISGNSAGLTGGGVGNTSIPGTTTTLIGCTVKANSAVIGGGIANQGTLIVISSNIIKNQATSAGGGISTTGGNATITDSVIDRNQVDSLFTALGGGIDCENSILSLTNCKIRDNQAEGATALGGGIYAQNSTVNLSNSEVKDNEAEGTVEGEGGGIYSYNSVLTLLASIVKGNKASTAFDDIFSGP